jgi:kumamolisin
LDNRPAATPHRVGFRAKHAAARAAALSLSEVANFYEFPAHLDGSGQTIAIIELDGGTILADVAASFRKLALKPPEIEIVLIDGQTNTIGKHLPLHPELNADDQVAMDIEIAGAIAPGARQVVYFAENTDQSFLKAVNAAIFATPRPVCISIGWGHPENSYTKQAMRAFEAAFQDAANLGIPVCVSVGNGGSFEKPTSLQVDFPASSPHALSCGGTTLHASEGAITRETGWSEVVTDDQGKKVRRGTGSGVSQFFAKPVYQSSVAVLDPPEGSTGGRGVPDVSANADPATGYQIRVKGREETIGGTSAAAPLWAGLIARMGQAVGGPVGFLNPQIYRTRIRAEGFRDITEGSRHGRGADGPYQATSGWNPCTGLGTPTAQHMTSQILERARRSASSAQPETPSPNLVEKKAVPHLPPAQPKIRRPVAPAAQMMAAVPLPAMKAAPAALEPAALIAPPRPALDQHEMGGPGASTTLPTDSFLFPAPPRNDGVSPSWQHGSGMGRDSDSAALAGILGITALTGMAAAVATLTCIALGNVKSSA